MAEVLTPIVVDLGKASAKKVKDLQEGQGPLAQDVRDAVAQVRAGLGQDAEGKRILPIVLVYRRKRPGRYLKLPLPF